MEIKRLANNTLNFVLKKVIEIIGLTLGITGLLLLISLITFSPDDPNFIFPENTEIQNILGFQGSFISDLLFQSLGLIAFLIPIGFFLSGINIILTKKLILII